MKKLKTFSICTLALLAACKKNDSNEPAIEMSKLYGRWSEVFDVSKFKGSAPDTTFYSKRYIWDYEPGYFLRIDTPTQITDTCIYTVTGTTLSWFDGTGVNPFYQQNIDVLNDTMLVLSHNNPYSDIIVVLKRI